jgi:basic amino acid/polyamine antiporter, APA family
MPETPLPAPGTGETKGSRAPDQWGERMPRSVGLINAIAVLVGITIGSGIFRVPATVAAQLQVPGPVLLCWVLGGLIALCGALTVAELAGALPRSGGIFAWLLESFGPMPAFLFGWTELAVIRAASLGATSTIFAEYLSYFIPLSPSQVRFVAAALIVVIGATNYIGVQRAAIIMSVSTVAKYAAVMGLGLLAFTVHSTGPSHFSPAWTGGLQLSLLGTALIPVMWTYDGWADLSFMGGEVKNPQRTLPLALIIGTVCVMVVYLVINVGFMHVMALPEMASSKLIATDVAQRVGAAGAVFVTCVVLVSTFSGLHGTMMTGPRIFFAMADRGLFFQGVARVSPRFHTPSVAIWLATVLGVLYVLENNFAQLANKFVLGLWPFYAMAVIGVFVLRRKRPELPRPYRVWGYPVVPGLFLLASLGMVLNALWTDPWGTGMTALIILAGVPMYYLWRRFKKS